MLHPVLAHARTATLLFCACFYLSAPANSAQQSGVSVAPGSASGSYSGVPLARKLGVPKGYFDDVTEAANICTTPGCLSVSGGSTQSSGVFAADFDADGWPDLFVLGRGHVPDRLFINQRDGSFADEAAAWGVAVIHLGAGGAVGDYDRDGDLDVFVTSTGDPAAPAMGQNKLYRNNGDRTFSEVAVAAGVNQNSTVQPAADGAAFGDYDLDGDLDLYVAAWKWWPTISMGNRLYRNEGDGTFTDVTGPAGVNQPFMGFSPAFADMDGDLYPEIMVAGDFGLSKYFVNQGDGTFLEQGKALGASQETNGMGQALGDLDSDGDLDWYVTSVWFSETMQGNKLYLNDGDGSFTETSASAGVANGGYGWGTVATDFDHDLALDLIETNGWGNGVAKLRVWRGLGNGDFVKVKNHGIKFKHDGQALVLLDYDRDGDQDLVVGGNQIHRLKLYRNNAREQGKRWLRVELDTSASATLAPNGIGTRVTVDTGRGLIYRTLDGGCNFGGQSELALHFGLADVLVLPSVEVRWADGTVTTLTNVPTNRSLVVSAP